MALTRFGLRLTASGSEDADFGSTGGALNLQKSLITCVLADRLLQPWLNGSMPTAGQRAFKGIESFTTESRAPRTPGAVKE